MAESLQINSKKITLASRPTVLCATTNKSMQEAHVARATYRHALDNRFAARLVRVGAVENRHCASVAQPLQRAESVSGHNEREAVGYSGQIIHGGVKQRVASSASGRIVGSEKIVRMKRTQRFTSIYRRVSGIDSAKKGNKRAYTSQC